jgi:hypothetical protein
MVEEVVEEVEVVVAVVAVEKVADQEDPWLRNHSH